MNKINHHSKAENFWKFSSKILIVGWGLLIGLSFLMGTIVNSLVDKALGGFGIIEHSLDITTAIGSMVLVQALIFSWMIAKIYIFSLRSKRLKPLISRLYIKRKWQFLRATANMEVRERWISLVDYQFTIAIAFITIFISIVIAVSVLTAGWLSQGKLRALEHCRACVQITTEDKFVRGVLVGENPDRLTILTSPRNFQLIDRTDIKSISPAKGNGATPTM